MSSVFIRSNDIVETGMLSEESITEALNAWKEPHRFYHNMGHLASILKQIETSGLKDKEKLILETVAIYHDVVYNPKSNTNEKDSAEVFKSHCLKQDETTDLIYKIILDTANDKPDESIGKLNVLFHSMDRSILKASFAELLDWERKIFKEFQYANHKEYKKSRLAFLDDQISNMKKKGDVDCTSMEYLRDYVQRHRPRIGIYAGSFNPFHVGHMNVLRKAEQIFDKVIVAIGFNPEKKDDTHLIQNIYRDILPYHQVNNFYGFISDFITKNEETANITLVRGLRNGNDLDYEANQLRFIKGMKQNLKVIYIPCDPEFEHISSSAIRNIVKISPRQAKEYLP